MTKILAVTFLTPYSWPMGTVVALVPPAISRETVEMLSRVLADSQEGKTNGAIIISLHPGRHFSIDLAGEVLNDPVWVQGIVCKLNAILAAMQVQ